MKNQKVSVYVKISCISLVVFFVTSFFWGQINYMLPSVEGIIALISVTSYFVFGAKCSLLIPEEQKQSNHEEDKYYNRQTSVSHNF